MAGNDKPTVRLPASANLRLIKLPRDVEQYHDELLCCAIPSRSWQPFCLSLIPKWLQWLGHRHSFDRLGHCVWLVGHCLVQFSIRDFPLKMFSSSSSSPARRYQSQVLDFSTIFIACDVLLVLLHFSFSHNLPHVLQGASSFSPCFYSYRCTSTRCARRGTSYYPVAIQRFMHECRCFQPKS